MALWCNIKVWYNSGKADNSYHSVPFTYAGTHLLDDSYLIEHLKCIKSALNRRFHATSSSSYDQNHVVDLDLEDSELKILDQGKISKFSRVKSRRLPPRHFCLPVPQDEKSSTGRTRKSFTLFWANWSVCFIFAKSFSAARLTSSIRFVIA